MADLNVTLPDGLNRLPNVAEPRVVLRAIAALPPGAVIATDADETLWGCDVGDEVMRAADAGVAPWPANSADFAVYHRDMMGGDYMEACRLSARTLALVDAQAAEQALRATLAAGPIRRWLAEALQQASARGVHVWIVSASPKPVVQWTAALHGFSPDRVLGIVVAAGKVVEPAPVGLGKVAAWRALGLPRPDIALGDSRWDGPLLASAKVGFLLQKASLDPFAAQSAAQVAAAA